MKYRSLEEMDAWVKAHGELNIICTTHNELLMKVVDSLSLAYMKSDLLDLEKARWLDYYCAAWLKLPQVSPCMWKVKK